jgi:hypothetical protein
MMSFHQNDLSKYTSHPTVNTLQPRNNEQSVDDVLVEYSLIILKSVGNINSALS